MKAALFLPCLILLLSAQILVGAAEPNHTAAPLPSQEVHVVALTLQEAPSLVEVTGTIQARQRATIAAKVTGTITEMPVVLGSRIKRGDLLVRISAEEINAQLALAKAQLARAERDLAREQNLLKKSASTTETVKSMRDQYAVAQAAFQEAQTMLGYTTINAPFAGVVTTKKAQPGDLATPGIPLLTLENDQELQVVSAVPEALVLQVALGDRLQVTVPTTGLSTMGTVSEIAPAADPASRTAPVKLDLLMDPSLRSGQFARVHLPGRPAQSLFVPPSALIHHGQLIKAFVVQDGKAHLRLVKVGVSSSERVEVLSGLSSGDQVIVDNNRLLVSGQSVDVLP